MPLSFTSMRKWVPSLASSEHPSLVALGAQLPALIQQADNALTAKASAEQQRSEFREVGDRKKFIDRVNAARKEAYGVLCTLPHKHPGLPSNFADGFFRRDRSKPGDEVTLETLEQDIEALKSELTEKEALREELRDAEEKAAQKSAEEAAAREAARVELEAIERDLQEKQKRADALKAVIRLNS